MPVPVPVGPRAGGARAGGRGVRGLLLDRGSGGAVEDEDEVWLAQHLDRFEFFEGSDEEEVETEIDEDDEDDDFHEIEEEEEDVGMFGSDGEEEDGWEDAEDDGDDDWFDDGPAIVFIPF